MATTKNQSRPSPLTLSEYRVAACEPGVEPLDRSGFYVRAETEEHARIAFLEAYPLTSPCLTIHVVLWKGPVFVDSGSPGAPCFTFAIAQRPGLSAQQVLAVKADDKPIPYKLTATAELCHFRSKSDFEVKS